MVPRRLNLNASFLIPREGEEQNAAAAARAESQANLRLEKLHRL